MVRITHLRNLLTFLTLTLLLTIVVSVSAQAGKTYYVATNGKDTNAGTEALPFLTVNKGVSVLRPGDTLLVKEGVYREELWNTIPTGTSWQQPITLRAFPGHQVILQPNMGAEYVITIRGDKHYIILDGFILDGTNVKYDAIKIAGIMDTTKPNPSHIRIINNEIRNVGVMKTATGGYKGYGSGILTTGLSDYVEYINNRIHDNGLTDFDHGIYHTSSYALIEGNIIYNNKGTGIKVGWGQNALNNIVRNNLIYDNNTAQGANGLKKQGRGIGVYSGSGTLVYNNVIWGAHTTGIDVTYGGNNAKIFNNTIISTTGYGIAVGIGATTSETATNTIIQNNLVYQQSSYPAIYNSRGVNTVFQNNLTFGRNPRIESVNPASSLLLNNLENVDPAFIDLNAKNFGLRASSPAIDKGRLASEVTYDFARTVRPQGTSYDIGAYEFMGQAVPPQLTPTVPVATTVPPTATPPVVTRPTVFLSAPPSSIQVGQTVSIAVNVANSANLYGLEIRCTTNPAILVGVDTTPGAIFTTANSLFMNRPYNTADGTWATAASLTRPAPAFSGNGIAFTLNYRLQATGQTPITCAVIAVDQRGATLPFDVINTNLNVQPPPVAQPTIVLTSPPELPPIDPAPLPTDAPAPTATVAPPTATAVPATPTLAVNTGAVSGLVAYQTISERVGIQVQLLANNAVVSETVTDALGAYTFNNLPPGSYMVKVVAPQHLAASQTATVAPSGQVVTLADLTLLAGDTDNNGVIDLADAGLIGANFGLDGSLVPLADLNRDNTINVGDLVIIGINFGLAWTPPA
jgi:hypothetical protein